jgi:hypothetical protein
VVMLPANRVAMDTLDVGSIWGFGVGQLTVRLRLSEHIVLNPIPSNSMRDVEEVPHPMPLRQAEEPLGMKQTRRITN